MKIANVKLKKILKWVSKTDDSGFNVQDIEKGLKLDTYQDAEKIFGFLKREDYIQHVGGNSPLYRKKSKVESELNAIKAFYEKPTGLIIIGVLISIIGAFIFQLIVLPSWSNSTQTKSIWQGVYYKHGIQENEIYGPVFDNFEACKSWALSKKNNNDDLLLCNKNCHDALEDGTPICETVVRNISIFPESDTFDNYKE